MKLNHIRFFLLVTLLIQITFNLPGSPQEAKTRQLSKGRNLEQMRGELFRLINQERKNKGLPTLYFKRELDIIARNHSLKMAQKRKMSHYFPAYNPLKERLKKANLFFIRFGENLALTDFPVAKFIHDGFMESPSHRKNILQPAFTHCGLGIVEKDKKIYITQIYAQILKVLPENEIEFLLKEELELWFVKTFNYRFVFHSKSQSYLRQLAKNYISRKTTKDSPRYRGNYYKFSLVYPDLGIIKNRIKEEIKKIELKALSIGVAMGRNNKYPGGTYAVAAFLFGRYYLNLPPEELSRLMFQTINQLRTRTGRSVLKLNPRLSRRALKILKSVYRRPRQNSISSAKYFTSIFSLVNPRLLPAGVQKFLQNRAGEIGIGLISKRKKVSAKNRFWACLILKKR